MSFILEDGEFTVSSGTRTLYTTTRRNPHIISKVSGTIEMSNLSAVTFPRVVLNVGGAWLTAVYFADDSKIVSYSFTEVPDFYSNSVGKFFILPFFKATLEGDSTSSSNPGDTGGKWVYSPGGAVFRVYAAKGYKLTASGAQGYGDTPTGYLGALTLNVLLNPPGYDGRLVVVCRNRLSGHTLAPGGVVGMFPPPGQSGSSVRSIDTLYTDASIEYVIYIGRF